VKTVKVINMRNLFSLFAMERDVWAYFEVLLRIRKQTENLMRSQPPSSDFKNKQYSTSYIQ